MFNRHIFGYYYAHMIIIGKIMSHTYVVKEMT
jgi:hypothetical protein